ncbi:NTP/NDP exchange transporter [Chlamydiales bacterium]|nr:NTP/NDP exchange transporter [Chlamydiales bacterium]
MDIKIFRKVFLPAVGLFFFLSCSVALFSLARLALVIPSEDAAELVLSKILKVVLQILFVCAIWILAKYVPFERVFRRVMIAFIGVISLFTGLSFFQGLSEIIAPLFNNISNLFSFSFVSILIWGFINRVTVFSVGIKYYLLLAFVFMVIEGVILNLLVLFLGSSYLPLYALLIPALIMMVFALILFNRAWKGIPEEFLYPKEDKTNLKIRFPYISAAYLLAGSIVINRLMTILFKSDVRREIPDPEMYSHFMGTYSSTVGIATIVFAFFWMGLGTLSLLKKGWKFTAFLGVSSLLIGGAIFLGFTILTEFSLYWLPYGVYSGLLLGTTSALFFPLIQVLYLYLPSNARFRTKVVTEMIFLSLMAVIPTLITQGLLVQLTSINPIAIYLELLTPIALLLLFVAVIRLRRL